MLTCEEETPEKERLRDDLFVMHNLLRRGSKERSVELFYLASNNKICENISKMCQERFKLDIRKHYFT